MKGTHPVGALFVATTGIFYLFQRFVSRAHYWWLEADLATDTFSLFPSFYSSLYLFSSCFLATFIKEVLK